PIEPVAKVPGAPLRSQRLPRGLRGAQLGGKVTDLVGRHVGNHTDDRSISGVLDFEFSLGAQCQPSRRRAVVGHIITACSTAFRSSSPGSGLTTVTTSLSSSISKTSGAASRHSP